MKIFTGILAIVIAIGAFWFSIKILRLYFKVKNWDRIQATVLSKEASLHERYSTSRSPYKLNVMYEYEFQGKKYTGNKVDLVELTGGQANHMKSTVDGRLAEILPTMSIYVNPENPSEAVMYCDGAWLYFLAFAMGVFALIFGIAKLVG